MKSIISISILLLVVIFSFSISEFVMPDVLAKSGPSGCTGIEKDTGLTCEQQGINTILHTYIEEIDNDNNITLGEKLQIKQSLEKLILLNSNIKNNPYETKSTGRILTDFERQMEKTLLTKSDLIRIEKIWFDNVLCDKLSENRCNALKKEVLTTTKRDHKTNKNIITTIESMSSLLQIVFKDVIEKPSDENSILGLKDCINSLSFNLDKSEYHQGDNIIISGSVSNTLDDFVTLNIVNSENNQLSYIGQYSPDKEGKFSDIVKIGSTFGGGLYSYNQLSNNKMFSEFFT